MCLLRGTDCIFIYRQFNIQQFYDLPTQCIYVFCVDLRTNSDYFYFFNVELLNVKLAVYKDIVRTAQ